MAKPPKDNEASRGREEPLDESACSLSLGEVTQQEGKPWFRYDYDSCDAKESWSIFIDVQEELRGQGWEIDDPQIEHDCLTGFLIPFQKENAPVEGHPKTENQTTK